METYRSAVAFRVPVKLIVMQTIGQVEDHLVYILEHLEGVIEGWCADKKHSWFRVFSALEPRRKVCQRSSAAQAEQIIEHGCDRYLPPSLRRRRKISMKWQLPTTRRY